MKINYISKTVLALAISGVLTACESSGDEEDKNIAPVITSSAVTSAEAEQSYNYQVEATDEDGDELTITVSGLPSGLSFDAQTGVISGIPSDSDVGEHTVVITVTDGAETAEQTFTIAVAAKPIAWEIVWSDEFDGDTLSSANWTIETGDGTEQGLNSGWDQNQKQWYLADNVAVADGKLVITAKKEESNGKSYTSGRISSLGKQDIQYGRIEASIKVPEGQSLWSAFSMFPTESMYGDWHNGGKLNLLEVINASAAEDTDVHVSAEYGMKWPLNINTSATTTMGALDEYHTYAMEWEPDEVRWYIDGVHYASITSDAWWTYYYKDNVDGFMYNTDGPFDQSHYMVFNLAVGGYWPGEPDDTTPEMAELVVDYVRLYKCNNGSDTDCVSAIDNSVTLPEVSDAYIKSYSLYGDRAGSMTWTVSEEEVTRELQVGVNWDNWGNMTSSEVELGGERGMVIDINTEDKGNVSISAEDGKTFNVMGMGNHNAPWEFTGAEFKFDLFIDSTAEETDAEGYMDVRIESGWPNLATKRLNFSDFEQDTWVTVSVPFNDLVAYETDDKVNFASVDNLFTVEFSGKAHVQLDNINLVCGHKDENGCGIKAPPPPAEPTQDVFGENLLSNGSFEDESGWTVISHYGTDVDGNGVVTIADGVVTFSETTSDDWSKHMGVYTTITLAPGTYQFDMHMSFTDIDQLWGEVYIGKEMPVEHEDYSGDMQVIKAFNSWDCGVTYTGMATESGCDENDIPGRFTITEEATYYLLFRSGAKTYGSSDLVLDDWSIREVNPVGENLISNGTFDDDTGWTVLTMWGEDVDGNADVLISDGVATFTETVAGPWTKQMAIYTQVELEAGTYQFDMDITFTDIIEIWGEVYIGSAQPEARTEYSGDQQVIKAFNGWDCDVTYDGSAVAAGCDDGADNPPGKFTITEAGTYYLLLRAGGNSYGTNGVVTDNWTLTSVE